jgi:hypothetical protein
MSQRLPACASSAQNPGRVPPQKPFRQHHACAYNLPSHLPALVSARRTRKGGRPRDPRGHLERQDVLVEHADGVVLLAHDAAHDVVRRQLLHDAQPLSRLEAHDPLDKVGPGHRLQLLLTDAKPAGETHRLDCGLDVV